MTKRQPYYLTAREYSEAVLPSCTLDTKEPDPLPAVLVTPAETRASHRTAKLPEDRSLVDETDPRTGMNIRLRDEEPEIPTGTLHSSTESPDAVNLPANNILRNERHMPRLH